MRSLVKLVESIFTKLPIKLQIKLYDLILTKIPFFILMRIPCSYSTYLKCYYPQKGDVVVDCGAHIGNCTIIFSRLVGRKGRVIAIEPFEESFRVLKGRLRRLKIGNVIPIKKGIWNENVKLSLKAFANTLACSVIENDNRHASYDKNLQIDCATLDYIAKDLNLTRLDIVKMDIEGAEIEAIEGADYIIKMFSPCFAIASYHHRNKKPTYYKIEQILSDRKYSVDTFFPPHLTTCGKKLGRYTENRS